MLAPVAAKVAVAVLRTRRGRRLLLAVLGGTLLAFSMVIAVLLSAVGAVAGQCRAESSEVPDSPTFVSQEPSGEALADIPADYLALYREVGEEYGLDWAVLAAVGKIETDHGRLDAPGVASGENSSGAGGPMQFLASTWGSVGVDGNGDGVKDRYDPEDAIPGAANYLKLEGAPGDYRAALFAYNNAGWYVEDVLAQAEEYRTAAGEQGGEMASSRPASGLATLLTPFAVKPAFAAEDGIVGSPGETSYSSPELETLDLINAYRQENGLEPLQLSDEISTAAARYAHDMAKYDAYSEPEAHVTGPSDYYPKGADLTARINTEGYSASRYGENIAAGQESAEKVFEVWRNSPSHDAMMLNPDMRAIGIGLVENPGTGYEEFWVTDFGSDLDGTARPVPEAGSGGAAPTGPAGSQVEGNARAVFPLEERYMDGYDDTWGASRGSGRTHEGTDLFAEEGAPIYSIVGGEVVPVSGADADTQGWSEIGGWTVMVEATESVGPIRAGDAIYYAHMLEPASVRTGDTIEAGDVIGKVGSTGEGPPGSLLQPASRGQHLHLGWYDPTMQRAEVPTGAMNPYPMLEWLKESGGTASGGEASLAAPGSYTVSLPEYCNPFVAAGFVRLAGQLAGIPGGSPSGGQMAAPTAPGSGSAEELLSEPNFEPSSEAEADLRNGVVDEGLISALQAVAERHRIRVSVFKTGHPYGASLPAYLGGGYNSHFYGRAADISEVDGKPLAGNGLDPNVLNVGRLLHSIPAEQRPDEVIGPTDWTAELGYAREDGFITDSGFTDANYDHIHVGRGAP